MTYKIGPLEKLHHSIANKCVSDCFMAAYDEWQGDSPPHGKDFEEDVLQRLFEAAGKIGKIPSYK